MMEHILSNRERREDVAFLHQSWQANDCPHPYNGIRKTRRDEEPSKVLFYELCYQALAAQPAPQVVVEVDWHRFIEAGVIDEIWEGCFNINAYAMDTPVSRLDSKGKVIDFIRFNQTCDTWLPRLLPQPKDADIVVDLLHACSGGALKAGAFAVIDTMICEGFWDDEYLDRYAQTPNGKVRKRATRMGLCDLPEKADTFADLKAMSRALNAINKLGNTGTTHTHWLLINDFKCEVCDSPRMASCPIPHCKFRRQRLS